MWLCVVKPGNGCGLSSTSQFPDECVKCWFMWCLWWQGSPGEVLKDPRVQCWIENYRNLLDAWRFWHKRAEFDIHRSKLDPSSKPLAQARIKLLFLSLLVVNSWLWMHDIITDIFVSFSFSDFYVLIWLGNLVCIYIYIKHVFLKYC